MHAFSKKRRCWLPRRSANRLARDLHDSVTQVLFAASLVAEVLPRIWRRDPKMAKKPRRIAPLYTRCIGRNAHHVARVAPLR